MILYGFLLAVAFLPNTVGGALAPRFIVAGVGAWALTLTTAPPRLSARRAWPLLAFILWVMLSAYWAPSRLDAINGLLDLFIAVSLFVLGAAIEDGEGLYVGLGVGAPFAMVFGLFDPNFDMAGEAAATAAVGLGAIGHPLAIIPALCVLLGHSRGGFLGLIVGYAVLLAVICRHGWCRWLAVAVICLLGGFLGYRVWFEPHGSLWERWAVWQDVWAGTSWLGNGLGSIWTVFPYYATHQDVVMSAAVQHAHNDFLEILFEQGYIGGSLAAIAAGALLYQRLGRLRAQSSSPSWRWAWLAFRLMSRLLSWWFFCVWSALPPRWLTQYIPAWAEYHLWHLSHSGAHPITAINEARVAREIMPWVWYVRRGGLL